MSHSDLSFLVNVREERSPVIDAEVEDTVLIRGLEGGAEDGRVGGLRQRREVKAMEWRQHAELELYRIASRWDKGDEVVLVVFGDLDSKGLIILVTQS